MSWWCRCGWGALRTCGVWSVCQRVCCGYPCEEAVHVTLHNCCHVRPVLGLLMHGLAFPTLTLQLVNALGREATPRQLTPAGSFRGGQLSPRAAAAVAAAQQAQQQQQAQQTQQAPGQSPGQLSAEQLSAALRHTLYVSLPAHRDVESASSGPASAKSAGGAAVGDSSRAASVASMPTSASMQSFVNRMLTDLVTVRAVHCLLLAAAAAGCSRRSLAT